MSNQTITKLAVDSVRNFSDALVDNLREEAYQAAKREITGFTGGAFAFIGEVGGFHRGAFILTEAMSLRDASRPRVPRIRRFLLVKLAYTPDQWSISPIRSSVKRHKEPSA